MHQTEAEGQKPVSGIMQLVKMQKGILSGKRHNAKRANAKRHNANRHNARRYNANRYNAKGITQKGITRNNQWPYEGTGHARNWNNKTLRIFWSVL